MYAQLIDDYEQKTLVAATSLSMADAKGVNKDVAFAVGKVLAEKAQGQGIQNVIFDRSGYYFHGRIQAVADGARKGGLKF
jgi:large subunit ribosomal protein L18